MASTTGSGWRHGPGGAGTVASTGRGYDTGSGCTGSTPGMFMPGSGPVDRVMAVGFTRAMMGAGMSGSSSGALSMALDTTILGMDCGRFVFN